MVVKDEDFSLGDVGYEDGKDGSDTGFDTGETVPSDGGIFEPEASEGDEKKPTVHTPRESTEGLISLVWGGLGAVLVQTGTDVPVGRVLQLQAPLAGKRFDELIAHTWVDKWLQPIASSADALEGFGSLVMLPLLVGAYERNPSIGPVIEGLLRQTLEANLADMVPVLRERKNKQRSQARALKDLSDVLDFEVPKGSDAVTIILQSIFDDGSEPENTDG